MHGCVRSGPMRSRYTHGYPAAGRRPHLAAWRLASRTPGALSPDRHVAKAVAAGAPACVHNPPTNTCREYCSTALRQSGDTVPTTEVRPGLGRLAHGTVMPAEPGGNRQPSGGTEATAGWGDDVRPAIVPTVELGSRRVQRAKPHRPAYRPRPAPCSPGPRSAASSVPLPLALAPAPAPAHSFSPQFQRAHRLPASGNSLP